MGGSDEEPLFLSQTSLDPFPQASQAFNAMEKSWGFLRERLDEKQPNYLKGGGKEFIQRLKAAVRRVNKNKADRFLAFFQHTKRKGQTSV